MKYKVKAMGVIHDVEACQTAIHGRILSFYDGAPSGMGYRLVAAFRTWDHVQEVGGFKLDDLDCNCRHGGPCSEHGD